MGNEREHEAGMKAFKASYTWYLSANSERAVRAAIDAALKVHDTTPAQGPEGDVETIADLLHKDVRDDDTCRVVNANVRVKEAFRRGCEAQRKRDEQEMLRNLQADDIDAVLNRAEQLGMKLPQDWAECFDALFNHRRARLSKPPAVDPRIQVVRMLLAEQGVGYQGYSGPALGEYQDQLATMLVARMGAVRAAERGAE